MKHGESQRRRLSRVVGAARTEHLDARHGFRVWNEHVPHWGENRDIDPDEMARVFSHGRRDTHPFWRLVLAVGRVNLAGEPTDEHLLAPHLATVARATMTVATWVQVGFENLVMRGSTTPPDAFRVEVGAIIDRLVLDLVHVRMAISACGMVGRYPSARRVPDGEQWVNDDAVARHCANAALRAAGYADQALRCIAEAGHARVYQLTEDTRKLLNASRLEYVSARHRPHPMLAPVGPLPFVLCGWIENESPSAVRAGLARTFALSRGTEFPDTPAVMNGVLADWLEEKATGPQTVIDDLRGEIASAHCPSCTLAEYWDNLDASQNPLLGPGW